MLIAGEWKLREDGIARPTVRTKVRGKDEVIVTANFLIDTGADRTVFSAALLERLDLPAKNALPEFTLSGIGGTSAFVLVTTVIEFIRDDGGSVRVRGEFASFTDPTATDLSVLGRDVLDNFDLVLSRRRNQVLLLAPRHHYHIEQG